MNKVIIFLQDLILIIAWYAYSMFLLELIKKNEFIGGIFSFFMANFKDGDFLFSIIFLFVPVLIIGLIWKKIFHR